MAFIFKPATVGGVSVRPYAAKLARQVEQSGAGSGSQVANGYVLRAVRNGEDVVVYVLDPLAVWAFLHHDSVAGYGAHLKLAARALNRDALSPEAAPLEGGPIVKAVDTALLPYAPGQGYFHTIDIGALFIRNNFPSIPYSQPERAGTCVLAGTTGNNQGRFATDRYQLWGDSFSGQSQPKFYRPGGDTSEFAGTNLRLQAWLLPEAGFQFLAGDSNARFYTRQMSRYHYTIPVFGAQCSRDGFGSWEDEQSRWGEVIVGGAYVSQPTGSDAGGVDPATDPARMGVAGVFLAKLLRPAIPPSNSYALTATDVFTMKMDSNPDVELRPLVQDFDGVTRYEAHGVSGVALAYVLDPGADDEPDGLGSRGATTLFYTCYCNKSDVIWSGVQLRRMLSSGAQSSVTIYKGTASRGHTLGPDLEMFGVAGVVGATFEIVGGVQAQLTTDLVHYGVDGVLRTTGLRAAGWHPFTQDTLNPKDSTAGTLFGQGSHFAAVIGQGKVAVLARDYVVAPSAEQITWSVVVIDQLSGAFIEARGVLGTSFPVTYSAHISVITPETEERPAVLLGSLDTNHYLSTDGGVTWQQVFQGFAGKPLYMGNQLHKIRFGEAL